MNVVNFAAKHKPHEEETGLLFSILYLWLEIKKQGLPQTAALVKESIDTFFAEMEAQGRSTEDYVQLRALLSKILLLNEVQIAEYVTSMTNLEHDED